MTTYTVTIDDTDLLRDLHRLGVDVEKVLEAALLAGADVVEDDANRRAPGPHITHDKVKKSGYSAEVDIGPDDNHWYYRFFERGAVPHPIQGSPLRFFIGGDPVFARLVRHPGMGAQPFLRPALDENTGQIENKVGDKLKKVIK